MKPSWFYRQSAAIPVRRSAGGVEILLVTSRGGKRWIVPKGIVDRSLSPAESAAKEAWEEAGVRGVVRPAPVGRYKYEKWGGTCRVEVFLLEVEETAEDWPEPERQRRWVSAADAADEVEEPGLRALLRKTLETLDQGEGA